MFVTFSQLTMSVCFVSFFSLSFILISDRRDRRYIVIVLLAVESSPAVSVNKQQYKIHHTFCHRALCTIEIERTSKHVCNVSNSNKNASCGETISQMVTQLAIITWKCVYTLSVQVRERVRDRVEAKHQHVTWQTTTTQSSENNNKIINKRHTRIKLLLHVFGCCALITE